MTEEEADYWDEYYTKNPPKVDPAKNRIKNQPLTITIEGTAALYLKSAAEAKHKTPAEVIGELVREHIVAGANAGTRW
ncbi:hypothetical protein ACYULU_15335 [Breznakiellaceae bacterium SP9]